LVAFQSHPRLALSAVEECAVAKKGARRKLNQAKPVAPFDKDIIKASRNAFDRVTRDTVSSEELKTYREALAQYHLCPESKFLNGDFADRGRTERRHVQVAAVVHIGKEANKWEEQIYTGFDEDAQIEYGADASGEALDQRIRVMCEELGERQAAGRLGIARETLRKALAQGREKLSPAILMRIIWNANRWLSDERSSPLAKGIDAISPDGP
jgi:hypothetical protein